MPKVQGVDGNDDDDDVAEKIHQAALKPTIFKEDLRITISESAKATPSKMVGTSGGGGGFKKLTPSKRPLGGGVGGG